MTHPHMRAVCDVFAKEGAFDTADALFEHATGTFSVAQRRAVVVASAPLTEQGLAVWALLFQQEVADAPHVRHPVCFPPSDAQGAFVLAEAPSPLRCIWVPPGCAVGLVYGLPADGMHAAWVHCGEGTPDPPSLPAALITAGERSQLPMTAGGRFVAASDPTPHVWLQQAWGCVSGGAHGTPSSSDASLLSTDSDAGSSDDDSTFDDGTSCASSTIDPAGDDDEDDDAEVNDDAEEDEAEADAEADADADAEAEAEAEADADE